MMEGSRTQAVTMERDADDKREHLESELRRVRAQAGQDREQLRNEALKLARELTDRARREHGAALASAKAQLDLEAQKARQAAEAEVPALARQISERLLGRSMG
jgi:F-type H+-transporting ATPase subunit b